MKVWRKVIWNKKLPCLSQKVCRVLSSSVLFFPCQDRDCEHAMRKITKSSFPWSKKSAFVIFSQLTNPRRYTSRNLFSAEHLARHVFDRAPEWLRVRQAIFCAPRHVRVPKHLAIVIENRMPLGDSNITLTKSLWFPESLFWVSGPPSGVGWSSFSFYDFETSICILEGSLLRVD